MLDFVDPIRLYRCGLGDRGDAGFNETGSGAYAETGSPSVEASSIFPVAGADLPGLPLPLCPGWRRSGRRCLPRQMHSIVILIHGTKPKVERFDRFYGPRRQDDFRRALLRVCTSVQSPLPEPQHFPRPRLPDEEHSSEPYRVGGSIGSA